MTVCLSVCVNTGDLAASLQMGHAWYCLDTTFRTVALLHLTASSLDFYLELNGTVWYLSAQKRRHTLLKLLVCWTVSLVLSLPPYFWYHSVVGYNALSSLRKLILCVFVLSFVFPLVAQGLAYAVLLRSWLTTRREFVKFEADLRGRCWPTHEARKALTRTESGLSRRGSHRRQPSYRGGRRSKGQPNKSSPQLDRHPSLRYSIKRRRSGASVVLDPAPPVTAALETQTVNPENADRSVLDPAAIEKRLVEVAASRTEESAATTSDQETTGLLPVQDQFLTENRGLESQRSSRSSKSDRGSDSPKIDRHPSLRFSTRRKHVDSSRKNSSRNSLEPAADPYLLLSGLQVSHKKLSTQVSFPDSFSWQEQNLYLPHGKAHLSSGEEIHVLKAAKKRGGSARRSANRKEIKRSQTSPKLDRHPSLRFSTKHKPTEKNSKKTTASTLSIPTHGLQGSFGQAVSDFCRRKTSSTLSMAPRNAEQLRPSRSTGGSNVSIGTCHDLQASLSFYSIKNKNLPPAQGTPKTPDSFHTPDDKLTIQDSAKNLINCHHQNLVRVAVSDRDLTVRRVDDPNNALSAPDAGPSGKRRRSAEDPASSSNRSSFRRRQFQRDTNHAVEDWLSLEAAARKPAVGQQRSLLSPIEDTDAGLRTATVLYSSTDVGHNRDMSPRSYYRRNAGDFALLSGAVGVTVLLGLPWAVAALAVGFCSGCGDESGARYPALLFCLQCLSSLVMLARPLVYHSAHGGFRKAFRGLMVHLKLLKPT